MNNIMEKGLAKAKVFAIKNKTILFQFGIMAAVFVVPVIITGTCEAATLNDKLPWSNGVDTLQKKLTGPLPKISATIVCAVSGGIIAFSEMNGMTKCAMQVVFGLGIATGAASLVSTLGNTGSGLLF